MTHQPAHGRRGATGVEYALLIALIAIGALAAVTSAGGRVSSLLNTVETALADTDNIVGGDTASPDGGGNAGANDPTEKLDGDLLVGTYDGIHLVNRDQGGLTEVTNSGSWPYTQGSPNVNAMTVDGSGDVFLASGAPYRVERIDQDGNRVWGYDTQQSVYAIAGPIGGSVFFGRTPKSGDAETLQALTTGGAQQWAYTGQGSERVQDLALGTQGRIFAVSSGEVHRVDTNGQGSQIVNCPNNCQTIAVGPAGNIYVGDNTGTIQRYDADGNLDSGWSYTAPTGAKVQDIVIDPQGAVYFGTNNRFGRVDPDGTESWSDRHGGDAAVPALALSASGLLYVGNSGQDEVVEVDAGTGQATGNTISFGSVSSLAIRP